MAASMAARCCSVAVPEREVALLLEDVGRGGRLRAVGHLAGALDHDAGELGEDLLALGEEGLPGIGGCLRLIHRPMLRPVAGGDTIRRTAGRVAGRRKWRISGARHSGRCRSCDRALPGGIDERLDARVPGREDQRWFRMPVRPCRAW